MTENEKDVVKEYELAQQLKDNYCDMSGKETDSAKAADIIHQIGKIYKKRSPDKLSLIKSVGLFNAAIVRNPSNITQVKSDLSEVCKHILELANARLQGADLIKKAEEVKMSVNQLRKDVEEFFKSLLPKISTNANAESIKNKIVAVKQINKKIAEDYIQIMIDLCKFCKTVMGKPPCNYAVVGMGSLAREEITPFSDFEHIILLPDEENYRSHLKYFQWFSVIFHVVILNVQETIIPSLNVKSLNGRYSKLKDWYYDAITPRGISFDGMMPHACKFPLGRQQHTINKQFSTELIKPVNKMLKYLSSEADLKNGYHLAAILTKTCLVFGDPNIYEAFKNGVQIYRSKKCREDNIKDVKDQVKNDLGKFSIRFRLNELKSNIKINIKHLVYRSVTLFIAALARIHNISANSCFDSVDEMQRQNIIPEEIAHQLQFSIAIACELRLRVYMKNKSQCDDAFDLKQDGIKNFLDVVGVVSTLSYFQITYCLQCEVAKQLKFTKLHFYSDPSLINLTIGLAFGTPDLLRFSKKPQSQLRDLSRFDFVKSMKTLESLRNFNSLQYENPNYFANQTHLKAEDIKQIALYLDSNKFFDEALEFFKKLLEINKHKPEYDCNSLEVAWTKDSIGFCFNKLGQFNKALECLNEALKIKEKLPVGLKKDKSIVRTLHNLGDCYTNLGKPKDALELLNRALLIKENLPPNASKDRSISSTIHTIGYCYKKLLNYNEAMKHFHQSLKIKKRITRDDKKDRSIASTFHEIGYCHNKLKNHHEALKWLSDARKIEENATNNADFEKSIAKTFHRFGVVYIDLKLYNEALDYLKRALKIRENLTLDFDRDQNIAKTFYYTGISYFGLDDKNNALKYLYQALEIRENITLNAEEDNDIVATLREIHRCCFAATLQKICRCHSE